MRKANIYMHAKLAGVLVEDEDGYKYQYLKEYLDDSEAEPISLTFPLQEDIFQSRVLFPFFDGLIPEGWLLTIAQKNWKLNPRDRMGLLLKTCHDCVGAVSVIPNDEDNGK